MTRVDLPKAIAAGIAPASPDAVSARRTGLVIGALAAAVIGALFVARELPDFALALVGGETAGVARYGGVVGTYVPAPGSAPHAIDSPDLSLTQRGARWVLELPKVEQAEAPAVIARLSAGGRLEFREVVDSTVVAQLGQLGLAYVDPRGRRDPHDVREPRISVDRWQPEQGPPRIDVYLYAHARDTLERTFAAARARGWSPPPNTKIVYEHSAPDGDVAAWRSYFVSTQVGLDGAAVARARPGNDPNTGRPVVYLDFTPDGARAFGELTARIVGGKLATLLGGDVQSAPMINTAIRGGRAVISTAGTSLAQMEHDRAAIVEALNTSVLPLGSFITDAAWVPRSNGSRVILARGVVAVLAGVLAYLIAFWLVRTTRPERRRIAALPAAAGGKRVRRFAWTAFAILVYLAGGWILLPGFRGEELARIAAVGKSSFDETRFSVFALGVTPWLTAFVVVELAAWIKRGWRGLRDTRDGRRRLERAVVVVTIVIAAVQAYFFVRYIDAADLEGALFDREQFWACTATLATGPMVLWGLASLISSRGVGNGFVVMIVVAWLRSIAWGALPVGAELALAALIVIATTVITLGVLGWRVRAPGRVAVPVPTSGIAPLHYGAGALALLGPLAALGATLPPWLMTLLGNLKLGLVVLVASTVLWAFVFARPGRREAELAAAKLAPTDRGLWTHAVLISTAALAALFALAVIAPGGALGKLCDPGLLVISVAMVGDVAADVRARRRADLVPVWPLHDPLLVDAARDVLADLPHVIQWTRVRTLLWMFGSFVPMIVLAPEAHAAEVHARLHAWLAPAASAPAPARRRRAG